MGKRRRDKAPSLAENAFARKALEELKKIDAEAMEKKRAQLGELKEAKSSIVKRIEELNHQIKQIDDAIKAIGDVKPSQPKPRPEKKRRRDWGEVRERIANWLTTHKGEKYLAPILVEHFPELRGQQVSLILKPLRIAGRIQTDTDEGVLKTKYFVPAA